MSRLKHRPRAELSDKERTAFDFIVANRPRDQSDPIGGPFDPWVRSPELAENFIKTGSFLRFSMSVDRRLIELGILVTGRFWKAQYEWYAHEPMARDNGLPEDVITSIRNNKRPDFKAADEEAVYDLAMSLHETHQVSDEVYARAIAEIGEEGVMEVIGLIGYYTMVSMTLNAFQVKLPDGVAEPLA